MLEAVFNGSFLPTSRGDRRMRGCTFVRFMRDHYDALDRTQRRLDRLPRTSALSKHGNCSTKSTKRERNNFQLKEPGRS